MSLRYFMSICVCYSQETCIFTSCLSEKCNFITTDRDHIIRPDQSNIIELAQRKSSVLSAVTNVGLAPAWWRGLSKSMVDRCWINVVSKGLCRSWGTLEGGRPASRIASLLTADGIQCLSNQVSGISTVNRFVLRIILILARNMHFLPFPWKNLGAYGAAFFWGLSPIFLNSSISFSRGAAADKKYITRFFLLKDGFLPPCPPWIPFTH